MKQKKRIAILIGLALFLGTGAGPVDAASLPDAAQSYIVVYEQSPVRGLRSLAADPAAEVKARLQEQTRAAFDLINGALVEMTPEEAESLAAEPGVAFVEPDYPVYSLSQTVPWGVERIYEAESYPFASWETTSGAGIGVAVLDSGIQGTHEDLPLLAGGISTIDCSAYDTDGNGHGTHVGGIVAAQVNSVGVVGTAPGVDLYSVKVLNNSGSGSVSSIIGGINWAVDNHVHIISMSLGTTEYSASLKNACDAAYAAGHLVIAAAGNSGNLSGTGTNMEYPAMFDSVIAVGATDSADGRASFSSTGDQLELMAPGDSILSTYPDNSLGSLVSMEDDAYYYEMSSAYLVGTGVGSVSGPVVYCGDATSPAAITAALAARAVEPGEGWIALIDRGDNTFAQKVAEVMAQGTDAAVIINDESASPDSPGTFTLADGVTPVPEGGWVLTVSVSYNAGEMIRDSETLTGTVEVGYDPYKVMSGTSMATPHVAGAAAVIWAAAPSLTNVQIREILNGTALDLGLLPSQQGSGLIQLNTALDLAEDMAEGRVLDLVALESDPGTVTAELGLCVLPGTQGAVYFALYDAEGRFLACSASPAEVAVYRQTLAVSVNYDAAKTPAKMKAFFLGTEMQPLGLQLETVLP